MGLWVFGCSFSVSAGQVPRNTHNTWTELLANKLGFDEYHNYAEWGVSNEFILDQFMTVQDKIQLGDYVIIQVTEKARQWFFKEKPEIGNFYITDLHNHVTKSQQKAVEMYITHLDNDELQNIRYALTCMALQHIAAVRKDCRIMMLPGFNYVPGAIGSLLEICNKEFTSDKTRLNWYTKNPIDIRTNHMSEANHKILAEKLFTVFKTGAILDLTTGFEEGFL
jgi:hypothetical protein